MWTHRSWSGCSAPMPTMCSGWRTAIWAAARRRRTCARRCFSGWPRGGRPSRLRGEKPYLLKWTANACKNVLRSFWRRNVGELDEALLFKDPADREVYAAVKALPPIYRAVIHLYYFEGYGQGEIGEILKISRTAVQTRMARSRAMLRKELSDDEKAVPAHDGAYDAR